MLAIRLGREHTEPVLDAERPNLDHWAAAKPNHIQRTKFRVQVPGPDVLGPAVRRETVHSHRPAPISLHADTPTYNLHIANQESSVALTQDRWHEPTPASPFWPEGPCPAEREAGPVRKNGRRTMGNPKRLWSQRPCVAEAARGCERTSDLNTSGAREPGVAAVGAPGNKWCTWVSGPASRGEDGSRG